MSEQTPENELANLRVGITAAQQDRDKAIADLEAAKKEHADALKAKDAAHADATKAAAEERLRAIQDAVEKVAAKANAAQQKLTERFNAETDKFTTQVNAAIAKHVADKAKLTEQLTAASLAIAELTAKNNADNDLANKLVQSYLGTDERRKRRLAEIEAEDAARAAERAELMKVGE